LPAVLRALPYFTEMTEVIGPGVREHVYSRQIVVWVSVTPFGQFELPPNPRRFPAILDTGLNDSFVISPVQLRMWAGLHWDALQEEGVFRYYGPVPVPTRRARVWLHPNQYGWRDVFDPLRPAVRIGPNAGITIFGNGEQVGRDPRTASLTAKRLPLLGLRALTASKCQFHIDCVQRLVSLSVPD
jgi:hypothetical protein